jgi:hypothetical protein
VLSRITINGAVLSQIKCAPLSAFSVSIHSPGVCTYPPFDPRLNLLFILLLPYLGAAQSVHRREPCLSDGSRCRIRGLVDVISELGSHVVLMYSLPVEVVNPASKVSLSLCCVDVLCWRPRFV